MSGETAVRDTLPPDPGGEPFAWLPGEEEGEKRKWEKEHTRGRRTYLLRRIPLETALGFGGVWAMLEWLSVAPAAALVSALAAGALVGVSDPVLRWRRNEDAYRRRELARDFGTWEPADDPSGALPPWRGEPGAEEGTLVLVWVDEAYFPRRPVPVEVDGETAGWMGAAMRPLELRVGAGERRVRARVGELQSQTLTVRVPAGGRAWVNLYTRRRLLRFGGGPRRDLRVHAAGFRERYP